MERLTMLLGALMVALGLLGYFSPELLGTGKDGAVPKSSPTALIPAAVGGVILLCGLLVALKPSARKHAMHVAALVGLLGAVGGFVPVMTRKFDFSQSAVVLGSLMTGLCVLFVVLCVRSFIAARIARSAPS